MGLTLVLGGTRSGKSTFAEELARASELAVRYVATADDGDGSMAARIARHVARRPPDWETVVAGEDLAALVRPRSCTLIDGLGTWIAGVMDGAAAGDAAGNVRDGIRDAVTALATAAAGHPHPVIVVAEQAGEGLLPGDALSRAWLDALGEATQALADAAERAVLVVAGRVLELAPRTVGAAQPPFGSFGAHGAQSTPRSSDDEGLRQHGDTLVGPGDADHAVNILAGGPPDWLRDALRRALEEDSSTYPREHEAVAALAALHGRALAEIVPCNGAAQALWLLPAALRPRLAACVHPGFTETEAALRAHGVPVARVLRDPDGDFALRPDDVPEDADLVVVGNPASPSGTLDPAAVILRLRRPGRTIVVDEAFMDLVPGEPESLVREQLPDVIVVRSLTKSLAIPGLRAGYAVAAPALAERLRAVRAPWSCNVLALTALLAMAERPEALAAAAVRAQAERGDLETRLRAIDGLRVWPAAANYVLVRVREGTGPDVTARLRDAAIAVRPAGSFPGLTADDLRITARAPAQNAHLADVLADAVARSPRASAATPPHRP